MGTLFNLNRLFNSPSFDELFELGDAFKTAWPRICGLGFDEECFDIQPVDRGFPKVNVDELDGSYEVEAALAGFGKENVQLELKENKILVISCDKKEEKEEKDEDKKTLLKELSSRSFRRVLNFPDNIDVENISSTLEEGVLKISLPKIKKEEEESSSVKIDIK